MAGFRRGELQRYDSKAKTFEPFLDGISAQDEAFSTDGMWVAYVSYPDCVLWRSKLDGSDKLQLSSPPIQARRGLTWHLIETRSTQSEHSKALAIFPRTLEIFDMAGLVGPFLQEANRVTSVAVVAHGHRLAHMRFTPEERKAGRAGAPSSH